MPNFALAFGNEAPKIEKMTNFEIFSRKNLVNSKIVRNFVIAFGAKPKSIAH